MDIIKLIENTARAFWRWEWWTIWQQNTKGNYTEKFAYKKVTTS